MKNIVMPKEGTLISESKTNRCDFKFDGDLIEVIVLESIRIIDHDVFKQYAFKKSGKCVFTKKQFEYFLFTNAWVETPVNITFEK